MLTGDPEGFARLTGEIARAAGMQLADYKEKVLRRRIAVRMRARDIATYGEYGDLLARDPEELEKLKDALTINVTRLYRNPETWDKLRSLVLPELLARREGAVRVWSAGCSSGEEPYTLALCLAEECERAGHPEWVGRATIVATDIDPLIMDKARAGRYANSAFMEMPPALAARYFREVGQGQREVVPALKRMVQVRRQDLLREPPPTPPYELVVCRNVVIYFDRDSQEDLFVRFHDALVPGGVLFLGKVETLLGPVRSLVAPVVQRDRIFRRH
ncbi:MAG TPA: protein-glutamate O-methyltransferase CheR [Anaeromyxobacteraceae bacterium]|nr:protein-glutamate O-methyltransferase CheR [Anaeromyxobacteraceae bacterium]